MLMIRDSNSSAIASASHVLASYVRSRAAANGCIDRVDRSAARWRTFARPPSDPWPRAVIVRPARGQRVLRHDGASCALTIEPIRWHTRVPANVHERARACSRAAHSPSRNRNAREPTRAYSIFRLPPPPPNIRLFLRSLAAPIVRSFRGAATSLPSRARRHGRKHPPPRRDLSATKRWRPRSVSSTIYYYF